MINKKSTIQLTDRTKKKLNSRKLTDGESYENIILRLLEKTGEDKMLANNGFNEYSINTDEIISDIRKAAKDLKENEFLRLNFSAYDYTGTLNKYTDWDVDVDGFHTGEVETLYHYTSLKPADEEILEVEIENIDGVDWTNNTDASPVWL
jgi:predicted CopG family antitoxin